jgi:hypothetical protein
MNKAKKIALKKRKVTRARTKGQAKPQINIRNR